MTGNIVPRTIILVPADQKKVRNFYLDHPDYRSFSWVYLSKNALLFTTLRKTLPQEIRFIDTCDMLQDTALHYRQDYIDFIGSLSVQNNSTLWWVTSVSEKNPFISTVFLNFCYLKIVEHLIDSTNNLVIICDSYSFIDAVKDTFASRPHLTITIVDNRTGEIVKKSSRFFAGILKKGYFAVRFISRICMAKCFAIIKGHEKPGNDQNKIALQSWTDARSFSSDGKYHDTYFGDMSTSIQESYPDFFTISYVLPTIFYPKAVWNLARCTERILLFEEFLSVFDVFRSLFTILVKMPAINGIPLLANIDLSSVIREEIYSDRFESSRSETSLLHYYAGRRLANQGGNQNPDLHIRKPYVGKNALSGYPSIG